jgi:DNA repair photolyase
MMKEIRATSILNKQKRRDDWFLTDYSVNPYSGCTIGCAYCYIRGSKYGEDIADSFSVKANAVELLERQLRRRAEKNEYGFIALSSATDPYVPIERKTQLTRRMLEVMLRFRFPVAVCTKSMLARRDFDLLKKCDTAAVLPPDLGKSPGRGAMFLVSISTLDEALAKTLEPGAPPPQERLELIREAVHAGLFAGIAYIPVLPFLSDTDAHLDEMIRRAKEYGAKFVFVGGLTLFGNRGSDSKTLYFQFLMSRYPHLLQEYERFYRNSTSPPGVYESRIEMKARELCKQYSVQYRIH